VRGWTASDFGMILGDFRQAESPLGRGGAFQTHMHPDLVGYYTVGCYKYWHRANAQATKLYTALIILPFSLYYSLNISSIIARHSLKLSP
jgi:hypothetical protein